MQATLQGKLETARGMRLEIHAELIPHAVASPELPLPTKRGLYSILAFIASLGMVLGGLILSHVRVEYADAVRG